MRKERALILCAMYKNAVEHDNLYKPYNLVIDVEGVGKMDYQYLEGKGLINIESVNGKERACLTTDGVDVIEKYLGGLYDKQRFELNKRLINFNSDRFKC
ncbi:hypothetical protein [Bacillus sp. JJ1474]|uniref:hypothetical protein n=1 Tax=Bacillus sp. JJ1474 TaxID=3122955 RepID=UPI002FFE6B19